MDEAWRFIQHPTLRAYVQEGLKTWRKSNAAMVLATQAVEDFASVDLLRTVVESCPTKRFLANSAIDRRSYTELFQLNDMELDLLTALIPRQQILLKRDGLAKVLTLTVDPKSYWIYTNTPSTTRGSPRRSGSSASRRGSTASSPRREYRGCVMARVLGCAVVVTVVLGRGILSVLAQTTGIREVTANARTLVSLESRLRYTTMIVLPDGGEMVGASAFTTPISPDAVQPLMISVAASQDVWSSARRMVSPPSVP
jgi:hypothetical protein